jgi:hypothetical protein
VGAAAGAVVPVNVRRYAQKHALYVLEQSGESVAFAEATHLLACGAPQRGRDFRGEAPAVGVAQDRVRVKPSGGKRDSIRVAQAR